MSRPQQYKIKGSLWKEPDSTSRERLPREITRDGLYRNDKCSTTSCRMKQTKATALPEHSEKPVNLKTISGVRYSLHGTTAFAKLAACCDFPEPRKGIKMMERFRLKRQAPISESKTEPDPKNDGVVVPDDPFPPQLNIPQEREATARLEPSNSHVYTEDEDPFMGLKLRRMASSVPDYRGDYIDMSSHPLLLKILQKQGDKQVLFADKVLRLTGSGKMKRRILLITEFAIYIVDPESDALRRRITLAAVEKMYLSALSDNFFAIIIPTEYDLLMVSTRKTEIVTVLVKATKKASNHELKLGFSNCFEYHAAADLPKEIQFEEVEGGVKTIISRRE
ncbi:uncharacterized protein LOC114750662 [Neltuma alba]|uniref:uncharacterized protein LOC114750662 n=1 Tax=Neltuma alba TaxID=207710 RepID=UPI0010A43F3E|nr:uncharacterized protein LOC114750662 [Prosopis alba]